VVNPEDIQAIPNTPSSLMDRLRPMILPLQLISITLLLYTLWTKTFFPIIVFFILASTILSAGLYLILLRQEIKKPAQSKQIKIEANKLNWDKRKRAQLINSLSGVKGLNLIATKSDQGESNLCIISSLIHLGSDPALMGFIIRPDTADRHTLNNLRQNQHCTVNLVQQDFLVSAHQTSARYLKDVSEFAATGLTEEYLNDTQVPFVQEAAIKYSFKMIEENRIKQNGTHFIIGEVQTIYFPENLLHEDGHLDIGRARIIGCLGLDHYQKITSIGRLSYAKTDKAPAWKP
jgi:flavin reductase (DIM6/NTAB) family NADH-FMN oxidoreductase RutF